MNIPEDAFALAVGAIMNQGKWHDPADAQFAALVALEAAAPHIVAQALHDAAGAAYDMEDDSVIDIYRSEIAEWLEARALEIGGKP